MKKANISHSNIVLAIVLVSYLMGVLDVSIVMTALPKMRQAFHASATTISWVHTTYTLAFGGLLLLGARAGDILGRKRMYMVGLTVFTLASLVIGISQSLGVLLAARAIQGVGAAILGPTSLALLTTTFPEGPERTRAVSYYGAAAGIGASIGLVLGGFLADFLSWRVGFTINLPIGIALMVAAQKYVAETERQPGQFDLAGAITSTLGMTAVVYGIVHATAVFILAGVAFLAAFVFNEWRAPQPIMPLRLLLSNERIGAYTARMLYLGSMIGFWFFMTQYLQTVRGYSAVQAAIAFLPMTVVSFATAVSAPNFVKRIGNGRAISGGISLTMTGMFWLSRLSTDTPYLTGFALPMMIMGVGQGVCLGAMTGSGIAGVKAEDAGAAAGLVNVFQQLGSSFGLAILVSVFNAANSSGFDTRAAFTHRVSAALTGSSIMLTTAVVIALLLIARPQVAITPREEPQPILDAA